MAVDVISLNDFSKEQILEILKITRDVKRAIHDITFQKKFTETYGRAVEKLLEGTSVATLFLENSTRTNYSFRAAVMKAGGSFDGFFSKNYTSLKKGETWADTVAMFAGYGYDALVIRSTTEGLQRWTKEFLKDNHQLVRSQHQELAVPFTYKIPMVINGGDGRNQHPTQGFLDLFTMQELAHAHGQSLDNLKLALLNDLAYGRTNASLMSVAHLFNFELHFAYPPRFGPREGRLLDLQRHGVVYHDHQQDFTSAMSQSFIAYHSRPQKERVGAGEDFEQIKKIGQVNLALYEKLGTSAPYLLHPLPVDADTFEEIAADMRTHEKNMTKLQSGNGLYVRIALLAIGLGRINLPQAVQKTIPTELYLEELPINQEIKELKNPRSGYIENDGMVLDHLPAGMARRLAGVLGFEKQRLPKVITDFVPVSLGKSPFKDMMKLHQAYTFSQAQYEAIALLAPKTTISFVQDGTVVRKIRPKLGNVIRGRVQCGNSACITNIEKEHATPQHQVESETMLRCHYCDCTESLQEIYDSNRFIYLR